VVEGPGLEPGAIRARGISFRYAARSEPALRDVSFDVEPGQCLLVVGPSGSGKSTLALALAGLVPGDHPGEWRGSLEVGGLDTVRTPRPVLAQQVGVVFQEPASQVVMEWLEDEIAFGLENRAWPLEAMRSRVPEALGEVGLGGLGRRRCRTLSGGQQQRLVLAGVLAPRPGVLVLDEPTSNLDPAGAAAFLGRLGRTVRERRTTVVLIEHRVDAAWPLADVVLALDAAGRPIASGSPDRVLAEHRGVMQAAGIWLPAEEVPGPDFPDAGALAGGAPHVARETPPARPLVTASELGFAYPAGPAVLHDISLAVAAGERIAVLGANGSGKTTLAKLLVGLLRPRQGEVLLGGSRPDRLPARELARHAGYVFQDPEMQFLTDRVRDEIAVGLTPGERAAADDLVESLGLSLSRLGGASPYSLSGGEKRRLSVACCLVRRPDLLVLDEPTFGQDRRGYGAMVELLRDRVEAGTALMAVTHDLRFAADVADRAVVLAGGRVAHDGALAALLGDGPSLRRMELAA
jgi:energy-coupling factor transport system ATP-binding protein